MAELVKPDGSAFDPNGVKITMPFAVTIAASFLVDAHNETQARLAIQRSTSFSAGIAPFLLGVEVTAQMAPPELLAQIATRGKG